MSALGVTPDILQRRLSSQTVMPLLSGVAYVDQGKLVVLDSHLSRIRVGSRRL